MGTAYRLDHMLAGPAGPSATSIRYLTQDEDGTFVATPDRPSDRRLSDHAMLLAELDLDPVRDTAPAQGGSSPAPCGRPSCARV